MILRENQSSSSPFGTEFVGDDDSAPGYASPNATSDRTSKSSKPSGKTVTVLLAEERPLIRQAFGTLFRPTDGIAVVGQTSESGHVFAMVEKLRPDVVVIAVRMALRIGLETIRRIVKSRWGSELLILLPTRQSPFVRHLAVAGGAGYLTEQDSSELLVTAIRKARQKSESFHHGGRLPIELPALARSGKIETAKDVTRLTQREQEALQMIAEGNTNKAMAAEMCISIKTVEKHRQNLMNKLGFHETASLTRYALYVGLVQ